MDFDAAMQAHANWKIRLTGYANGIVKDKPDAVTAGKDNACQLGQWLHGEAKAKLAGRPDYAVLVSAHAEFHRQAAAVIRTVESGQLDKARGELDNSESAYRKASSRVISLLMEMKAKVK